MIRFAFVASLLLLAACDTTEPDTLSPSVNIVSPSAGTLLVGTIAVEFSASEPGSTVLLVDGAQVGTSTGDPFQLNTATLSDGDHTLQVRATDEAGNSGTSASLAVVVYNDSSPRVTVTTPVQDDILTGTASIQYEVLSASPIVSVDLLVDGVDAEEGDGGIIRLDTEPYADGTYQLAVRAEDADGDVSTSETFIVTFRNDAQSVGVTSLILLAAPFTRPGSGLPWDQGFQNFPDFHLSLEYTNHTLIWDETAMEVQPSDLPIGESGFSPIQLPLGETFQVVLYESDGFIFDEVAAESETIVLDQVRERPSTITLSSEDGRFVAEFDLVWTNDPPSLAPPTPPGPLTLGVR